MAQATSIKFGTQAILLGDGSTSEEFAAPCGLTSLSKQTNVETNTTAIPDCDDPDLAVWLAVDEVSRQMTLSGSGLLAQEALDTWREWDNTGGFKNVRWLTDLAAANGGGHYEGEALLTQFEETGERGQRWQVNIGITFSGKPTWTDAQA
ncbi:phage tail tube protein [Euryhalocaulis caribicus]|uniref:phage tail tube protein n=1 Tax=Euryhalocaulis caribicus TaxID=1161401 RepID=UPI0003A8F005|nr:phage tail tube protein [Euryhalocaulis caribicus]